MDAYALHLAMAALVGASFVAVSAYYMHRKTLNQLLEFAKTVEEREEGEDELLQYRKYTSVEKPLQRRNQGGRRNGFYRRASTSLPDVTSISGGAGGHDEDAIPAGLPKLHTLPEGRKVL